MRPAAASLAALACATAAAVTLGLTSARREQLLELTSLGMVLSYGLLLLVAAAYALGRWRSFRWQALGPMALLLTGIPAVPLVRDADRMRTDQTFSRQFPVFEAFAKRVSIPPGGFVRLLPKDLPEDTGCCYRAVVRRSPSDELSAIFMLRPRLAYLYDPTGTYWRDGVSKRWRDRVALGPGWYRLTR